MINWKWLAGFYEGEGCAGCYKCASGRYILSVKISQSNKLTMYNIMKFIGYGSIYRALPNKKMNRKSCYVLSFNSTQARKFLIKILSYCNTPHKIKQINKALRIDRRYVKEKNQEKERTNTKDTVNTK